MTKADKEGQREAPILRFKGFTDAWEQRKLKQLGNIKRGASPRPISDPKWFDKNGKYGWLRISDVTSQNGQVFQIDQHLSSIGEEKTILISDPHLIISIAATVGKPCINYIPTAIHDGFVTFLDYKFNLDFMFEWFNKNQNIWLKYGQPGAQINLNSSIIGNQKIKLPKAYEQEKIAKLFDILNNLLALYERKTRLLGKLRMFLTQRLFSNSSKVSLYFDNKNWSEHKISEFLTERNEKVVPNSSIPLVSFTVEKGVTPKSKRYNREFLVKDDNKKYKITKKDDIVYNPANLKFGAIARNKFGNAAFSPIYVTFITKLNPAFTEFLVRRKDFINLALKYQEGTVYERMAVKSKDFLNLKIYLPNSSRDINHIAQILQSLDTLVSLNKNKVSLVTLIKKELLNTMFI